MQLLKRVVALPRDFRVGDQVICLLANKMFVDRWDVANENDAEAYAFVCATWML